MNSLQKYTTLPRSIRELALENRWVWSMALSDDDRLVVAFCHESKGHQFRFIIAWDLRDWHSFDRVSPVFRSKHWETGLPPSHSSRPQRTLHPLSPNGVFFPYIRDQDDAIALFDTVKKMDVVTIIPHKLLEPYTTPPMTWSRDSDYLLVHRSFFGGGQSFCLYAATAQI